MNKIYILAKIQDTDSIEDCEENIILASFDKEKLNDFIEKQIFIRDTLRVKQDLFFDKMKVMRKKLNVEKMATKDRHIFEMERAKILKSLDTDIIEIMMNYSYRFEIKELEII